MINMMKTTSYILLRGKMSKASIGSWRSIRVGRVVIGVWIRVVSWCWISRCSLRLLRRMWLLLLCSLISIVITWRTARRIAIRLHWHRHRHATIRLHWVWEIRIRRWTRMARGHMCLWCSWICRWRSTAWSSIEVGWRWPSRDFAC